ncbi:hypothetical protein EPN52_15045 [bacterium]|nr:MAG: hypothetical protein EPN52_15045 [bacterium]
MLEGPVPWLDRIVRLAAPRAAFTVTLFGCSMRPALREGDRLIVEPLQCRPHVGDVVVFPYAGRMLAHRVIACAARALITAGDASSGQRERIALEDVVGVVRAARRGGRALPRPSSRMRALLLRARLAIGYRLRMGRAS